MANPFPMAAVVFQQSLECPCAHALPQEFAHFRNATCIVGDGAERINGKLHSRGGHHGACGNRHPIEAAQTRTQRRWLRRIE